MRDGREALIRVEQQVDSPREPHAHVVLVHGSADLGTKQSCEAVCRGEREPGGPCGTGRKSTVLAQGSNRSPWRNLDLDYSSRSSKNSDPNPTPVTSSRSRARVHAT